MSFKKFSLDEEICKGLTPSNDEVEELKPMGDCISDLELLLDDLLIGHDLQHGDVLNLVRGFMEVHYPEHKEEYIDGTKPIFYYGRPEGLK